MPASEEELSNWKGLSRCRRGTNRMAGGVIVPSDGPAADHGGSLTLSVFMTCLVAASGGLIFGYDIGISGLPLLAL
jgi:hypothetical protein